MVVAIPESGELDIEKTELSDDETSDNLRYEIAAYPTDFTIRVLYDKWRSGQLIIPDFQRRYVWSLPQASRFIESFLLGLPIPQVFLYRARSSPKMIVVDGQQRLSTIAKFYDGQFDENRKFRLRGVSDHWNNRSYEDLDEDDRYHLDDCTLRSIVIQQLLPDDNTSMYRIFERLNTGGTQLNAMEIRKALYFGSGYDLLERLNEDENWRELIGKPTLDSRLRDVEIILRILALAYRQDEYSGSMKKFLTEYMGVLFTENEVSLNRIENRFKEACQTVYEQLGDKPFHLRGPLNLAAIDSVMATAVESLESLEPNLKNKFDELCEDSTFQDSITSNTSHTDVVMMRFNAARAFLLSS